MNERYVIVMFPELKDFMKDKKRFNEEALLIDDDDRPIGSTYAIPEKWYNEMYNLK